MILRALAFCRSSSRALASSDARTPPKLAREELFRRWLTIKVDRRCLAACSSSAMSSLREAISPTSKPMLARCLTRISRVLLIWGEKRSLRSDRSSRETLSSELSMHLSVSAWRVLCKGTEGRDRESGE